MIPLKILRRLSGVPFITYALIAVNFVVFFHQLTLPPSELHAFVMSYALVPARVQAGLAGTGVSFQGTVAPFFTSMFLHAGWMHIIGNMWFLWLFGAHGEDRIGHGLYLFLYLICGLGAGVAQTAFTLGSHIPSLGASGAIAGVLGAYLVLFPSSRILTLVTLFFWWFLARLPAALFIGLWFLIQFLSGLSSIGRTAEGGVAWWAHVGGFVLGLLLVLAVQKRAPRYEYD